MSAATIILLAAVVVLAAGLVAAVLRLRRAESDRDRIAAETAERQRRQDADLRRAREDAARHRAMEAKLQQAWRAEREWSRELRSQVSRLSTETRHEGGRDVRTLVLEAAIELCEGDRGLLLSREDADDDGALDVVASRGFDHDPADSAVAQRFAREVLERDQIIREDEPSPGDAGATPADAEIRSLVAIPVYLRDRFHGVVVVANRPGGFEEVGDEVLLALGDHAGAALQHGMLQHQLESAQRGAIRTLTEAIGAFDPFLHRETGELVVYALRLAHDLGLDERDRDVLVAATMLRAVGYLALPDSVLRTPGPLTLEQRQVVELHPRIAFNVISPVPALRDVATAVLHHHERFDGTGYPAGLADGRIPLASRALAVLEAYGAMTNERPFRPARPAGDACAEIVAGAGTQFDPEIAHLLVEQVRRGGDGPSDALAESILEVVPFHLGKGVHGMLGPLDAGTVDGLTLLGDHRALQVALRQAVGQATPDRPVALALVQLEDLPRLNDDAGFLVGDRLIQLAARNLGRVAARVGGTAFRSSGRRLALLAPGLSAARLELDVAAEFTGGPEIRQAAVGSEPGERAEEVLRRARRALDGHGG